MKALITAGGIATRLRPLTWTRNKHLIPLANKPMIFYAIEKIVQAGITDIAININEGDTQIQNACGDGSQFGCTLSYIEQKGGAKGLAHIIKNAKDFGFLDGTSFILYLGDNILLADLSHMRARFEQEQLNCLLALSKVKDPERFGVPEIVDGRIIRVEEKPSSPKSDYAITGIYFYDAHSLDAVEHMQPSERGEYEITNVHQYYIDKGLNIAYQEITGWWKDTGKPSDLLVGNQFILDEMDMKSATISATAMIDPAADIQGKVKIGEGTRIGPRTLIRGPVVIGDRVSVESAFIGPYTSIGDDCLVHNAQIEHSIILNNSTINTSKVMVDSIIGEKSHVVDSRTQPTGNKFVIGDNSSIEW